MEANGSKSGRPGLASRPGDAEQLPLPLRPVRAVLRYRGRQPTRGLHLTYSIKLEPCLEHG